MSNILKAVIIDEKENRINQIKSFLPDYIDFSAVSYGDNAKAEIVGSNDGRKCNVVIMYGDDIKGHSVYMFDWLKNSGAVPGLEYIPVVILTKDEFSDRSLEILELGDCFFYEGEIEDDEFYSVVMEAIESYDDELEEEDTLFAEVKNPEKIMGMSYVMPSEPVVPQRTMVLSDEEMIKGVISSIETGKKETAELREIITQTYKEAVEKGVELSWAPKTKEERGIPKEITFNEPEESFEYRKQKYLYGQEIIDDEDDEPYIAGTVDTIHKYDNYERLSKLFYELDKEEENVDIASQQMNVGQQYQSMQPGMNTMQQAAYAGMAANQMMGAQALYQSQNPNVIRNATVSSKKRILVIDYDEQTIEIVKTITGDSCIVESVDSPMKAIDYFIRGYADTVVIEYNMKSMNALQVVQSIKMQPGGMNAKVIVMLKPEEMQYYQTVSASPLITGIIGKPIQKNQLEALI